MDTKAAIAWFLVFQKHPVLFHGFQYALAVHHDLLCNQVSWSSTGNALVHKTQTIRLLNAMLSGLTEENIELAILAVLVLASNELKHDKLLHDSVWMFDPHMPGANWNSVYSRMEQVGPLYYL